MTMEAISQHLQWAMDKAKRDGLVEVHKMSPRNNILGDALEKFYTDMLQAVAIEHLTHIVEGSTQVEYFYRQAREAVGSGAALLAAQSKASMEKLDKLSTEIHADAAVRNYELNPEKAIRNIEMRRA